jgi:hypothetical protein
MPCPCPAQACSVCNVYRDRQKERERERKKKKKQKQKKRERERDLSNLSIAEKKNADKPKRMYLISVHYLFRVQNNEYDPLASKYINSLLIRQ